MSLAQNDMDAIVAAPAINPPPAGRLRPSWRARAFSGDSHASLLLPHQLLVSHTDAQQHGIADLSMLEVLAATDDVDDGAPGCGGDDAGCGVVLLECIVDRRPASTTEQTQRDSGSRLGAGSVQVSAWVLEFLRVQDGSVVTLRRSVESEPQMEAATCHSVTVSLRMKYPTTVSFSSGFGGQQQAASSNADREDSTASASVADAKHPASALQWLPESVRSGKINLENVLERQLRNSFFSAVPAKDKRVLRKGCVVPMQLLQETYIFRVEDVCIPVTRHAVGNDKEEEDDGRKRASHPKVYVVGWSSWQREAAAATEVDSFLTDRIMAIRLQDSEAQSPQREEKDSTLVARLWHAGFAGYNAFFHDALLNIALIVKGTPRSTAPTSTGRAAAEERFEQIGSHGVLLSGVHGVGKSLALQVMQSEIERTNLTARRIDGMSLLMESENTKLSSTYEFLLGHVQDAFPDFQPEHASASHRSSPISATGVLLIDDIDVLFQTPSGETSDESDSGEKLTPLGSALLRLLDAISEASRICIVGTTSNADVSIPMAAKRAGRFGKIVEMIVPTEAMRGDILARHLSVLPLAVAGDSQSSAIARDMATRLAALTGGYVAKDLVRICRNALVHAHKSNLIPNANHEKRGKTGEPPLTLSWDDLLAAQQLVKPSQLRELNVASPGAGTSTDSLRHAFAGYSTLQKQLTDFISWKFNPTAAMNRLGVANASGILLHGPSGCGKSLLVRTLAAHARVNFVSVKSSEIMSKYFGDSEKAVRQLFARARAASPCILFFDEFDAIAHKRSFGTNDDGGNGDGGGDSVYARILSTFLNEMDGVGAVRKSSSSSPAPAGEILVVAATNRIDALDAALVRSGRIDKTVEIGFPTVADKEEILGHYTRKMPLAVDVDISTLAAQPTGNRPFTGADLAAVCKDAAFRALREDLDAKAVCMRHFEEAWDGRVKNPLDKKSQ